MNELILDFRKCVADRPPVLIIGACVERVHSFTFLGTHVSDNLSWLINTAVVVQKAPRRLSFLGHLKKNNLRNKLLVAFYRSAVESILTCCLTVWYTDCSAADQKATTIGHQRSTDDHRLLSALAP